VRKKDLHTGGFCGETFPDRDRSLVAAAYHSTAHRKNGDPLEPSHRFGHALGIEEPR
jgi:hypothetical protein